MEIQITLDNYVQNSRTELLMASLIKFNLLLFEESVKQIVYAQVHCAGYSKVL